jgi:pyrimidine operon attenuation protein/uracil phosphoribosyltransferase
MMTQKSLLLDARAVQRTLTRMAHEIAEKNADDPELVLVGIQRGGAFLAHRLEPILASVMNRPVPMGVLDVSMHRDDLDNQIAPEVRPTNIPVDITGKTVILIDDVLFSGRTTRAAMDALNDFGRPRRIQLAVLIDRGHRELPIKADFVGKNVPTAANESIDVQFKEAGGDDVVYLEKA